MVTDQIGVRHVRIERVVISLYDRVGFGWINRVGNYPGWNFSGWEFIELELISIGKDPGWNWPSGNNSDLFRIFLGENW